MKFTVNALFIFRIIAACLCFINIEPIYGQIHISSKSLSFPSNDPNINDITQIWEKYISLENKREKNSLWYGCDYIEYLTPNTRMYNEGFHYTFNISHIRKNLYEINTISYILTNPNNLFETIESIYKVCAIRIDGEWQLTSFLDANISHYKQTTVPHITYIYPHNYCFTKHKARIASKFIETFCDEYNLAYPQIKYVVANTIDEANYMIGFIYSLWRSDNTLAGRTLYPNTILSTQVDHIHELVHAVILPNYPRGHYILQEGIATYYGGTAGKTYSILMELASLWLQNNHCDFSDFSGISNIYIDDNIPLTYLLGARLVEYIIDKYGTNKVLELLQVSDYVSIFNHLEIDDINNFVINLFLK